MILIKSTADLPLILDDMRVLLGLRQKDFAAAAGFRQSQISGWVNGHRSMDTGSLIRLAAALGYDLALIPREDTP